MSNVPARPQRPAMATPMQEKLAPDSVAKWIIQRAAEVTSRVMYPLAVLMPDGAVALNNLSAPVGLSQSINLTWPTDGMLVAIAGTTQDGLLASMAGVGIQIVVDGQYNLISSGANQGSSYVPLAQVSGANSTLGRYLVKKEFRQATSWSVFLQNNTGAAVPVDLRFDYIDFRGGRI